MNRPSIVKLVALLALISIAIPAAMATTSTASIQGNEVKLTELENEYGGIDIESDGDVQYVVEADEEFEDNEAYRIESEDDDDGNVVPKQTPDWDFTLKIPANKLFCILVEREGGGNVRIDLTLTYVDDPSVEHTVVNNQNNANRTFYSITDPNGGAMEPYLSLDEVEFADSGAGIDIEVYAKRAGQSDTTLKFYVIYA